MIVWQLLGVLLAAALAFAGSWAMLDGSAYLLLLGVCLIAAAFGVFTMALAPRSRRRARLELMDELAKLRRERAP